VWIGWLANCTFGAMARVSGEVEQVLDKFDTALGQIEARVSWKIKVEHGWRFDEFFFFLLSSTA